MDSRQNPIDHIYGSALPNLFVDPETFSPHCAPASGFASLHPSPCESQLRHENTQLRAQLTILQTERQIERQAYNAFAIQAQSINGAISPDQKTHEYQKAYQTLVNISQTYTSTQRQPQQYRPSTPYQSQFHNSTSARRDSALDITTGRELDRRRTQHEIAETKSRLRSQISSIVLSLRSVSHRIASSTPNPHNSSAQPTDVNKPRQRLAIATKSLENNVCSFADFLAAYVNGRYDHLSKDLRPKLKALLEPFFAEPSDVRALLSKIVSDAKGIARVESGEMGLLSQDLIGPLGDVLEALVAVLEDVERSLDN